MFELVDVIVYGLLSRYLRCGLQLNIQIIRTSKSIYAAKYFKMNALVLCRFLNC